MAKKVFIVEDDGDLSLMLQMLLEEEGYHVITSNYPDTQEILAQKPDLLLVDLWFGEEKEGEQLVRELKSHLDGTLPIIMMSSDHEIVEIVRETRAEAYLIKPFDIEIFLKKVKSLVAS
ncbi:MAG TPA: response regulator [Patescibacteria group bacterium]